ncbi:hypothetical protein ACIBF1_08090 [Spirillospora sp. NPDC050679]
MARPPRTPKTITRLVDGLVHVYDLESEVRGVLPSIAAFRPSPGDRVVGHTAFDDKTKIVYTTLNEAVCVTGDGAEVWRTVFEPRSDRVYGHRPGCALSADETAVWVYRPDAMAGRDRLDQWVALDAATGKPVAQADLETVGHGAQHLPHPSDGHVLLDVGEGQDGAVVYRAALTGDGLALDRYPWGDRCLVDLSPDGSRFMTVHHGQEDVAFHSYPDGGVLLEFSVDDFLPVEDVTDETPEFCLEWSGGFLTADVAIVVLAGETDDDPDWFRSYRVDLRTRRIASRFEGFNEQPYDLHPLGDGTWLTTDPSGHPVRWSES